MWASCFCELTISPWLGRLSGKTQRAVSLKYNVDTRCRSEMTWLALRQGANLRSSGDPPLDGSTTLKYGTLEGEAAAKDMAYNGEWR